MRRLDFDAAGAAGPRSPALDLAGMAVAALRDELDLTPKPGLVDRTTTGAHRDMDHALMTASALALEPGFAAIATAAAGEADAAALRAALGVAGREAEAAMMQATHGVNTHRGAIWALGLIVAAAAATPRRQWQAVPLLGWVAWMAAIDDPVAASMRRASHGTRVVARYRVAGARGEAIAGFPQIVEAGLPALHGARARARDADEDSARLDALAAIIAVLDDTCVLHRAGASGLAAVQRAAAAVAAHGGSARVAGRTALAELDAVFLAHNASPGGAADLLAATLLVDRLETAAGFRSDLQETNHANAIA
ncbi:triphosphoribosyl-dephospho-CoA synthase [Salinisphaera sp. LB1]|uniref:triphosphoribosyl-dephospho-CoA synthase n=1 Tax=Salinisphaera sp. LB1 TaxID=2183911 RepID=UPI000D708556|nr:triphosphoribosyl-dephospho-CoA synthase [Salinisphaera sp. LB1]AWN16675.1 Triphosphoribosyl-dephospho-CoA synthetase [Salinisphaera sp. LB1]